MRYVVPIIFVAMALVLAGCGKSEKKEAADGPGIAESVPLGPLPRVATPIRYRLSFVIDPAKNVFTGHDEIDVTFAASRQTLFLHGLNLAVSGAEVRLPSGRTITAHYDQVDKSGVARLVFVDKVPRGPATLVFDYEAPFDRSLSGLYKVMAGGDAYAFTQFETTDARRAFPSFDEPGFKTPFDVTITAPRGDEVIANTAETSITPLPGGLKRIVFAPTKPLPTYLVAMAVGPFDIVDGGMIPADAVRSHPIHLRGITAKGQGARIRTALSLTPKVILALENYFGVAYPFPKLDMLAVPDFGPGAMENAGAVTFRERLLLFDADAPLEQKRASLLVQAHELTHQWFGDLVTPQWWDDTWLNESFANWMAAKAAAAVLPELQFDTETLRNGFDVMETDELAAARQIHQPVRTQDDISDAFDGITYDKGASVLSMFENYIGDGVWRAGIHAYLTKYANGNATAKDFIDTIAQTANTTPQRITITVDKNANVVWNGQKVANDTELKQRLNELAAQLSAGQLIAAFNSYIDQPGIPMLRVAMQCKDSPRLDVTQSMYEPIGRHPPERQWGIPICASVGAAPKTCRLMNEPATSLALGKRCPAWVLPNAGGKGYYRFSVDEEAWHALIAAAPKFSPADQITLLENLNAALHAGNATAGDLFALIHALAPTARWDVIDRIATVLHQLRETGLSGENLAAYRSFVRSTFDRRLHSVGLATKAREKAEVTLARGKLVNLLVVEGVDPQTIAGLSALAHAAWASDGKSSANLAPDLMGDALRASLIVDPSHADVLVQALETSNDEYFRRNVIYAFSGSSDPAVVDKLLAAIPKIRTGELRYLYQFMAAEPVARSALWDWFRANYASMKARVSAQGFSRAPAMLGEACDAESRNAMDGFFRPKLGELDGVARPLALAEQRIDRCMAFKASKGAEIAAALKAQAR